ncbi:hypothetical protein WBJ53_04050 [Spirosoma sp. SC4-14]|uniref:hypothetical protein n=1 Tax=Spirosoma sp. SC4-14 TaxID=3128900 RepID=UPI0030CFCF15
MNAFSGFLPVSLTLVLSMMVSIAPTLAQKARPTKLAHYEIGSYITADSTRLRVNVNKELGGEVHVHLVDITGHVLFEQLMDQADTTVRLSLNLMELAAGNYALKVSNGLDVTIREFQIISRKPVRPSRTITLLSQKSDHLN